MMKPTLFLAFANDRSNEERYLRNIARELRDVRRALTPASSGGSFEILERANAELDEILEAFQTRRHRIAVFHYGGHASSFELLLESTKGRPEPALAGGLAAFLRSQRGLQLVFLNACSTRAQAKGLLDAGVPAVIATSRAVDDAAATTFAARFYGSLAGGATIREAFDEATSASDAEGGAVFREVGVPGQDTTGESVPWELHCADEEAARWTLASVTGNPLFGLPEVPTSDLPDPPFRGLGWIPEKHAEIFFGRGREIRDLFDCLTDPDSSPIQLLYGQSGVGKSSLLAAGLLPRLRQEQEVRFKRRAQETGLTGALIEALESGEGAARVAEAWKKLEERHARPVTVILDQVEEAITAPNKALPDELDRFVDSVEAVFADRASRPRGRLLLSFRKEWLAEIEHALARESLPSPGKRNVLALGRAGVKEIVDGLASSARLRQHYGLVVEEGLSAHIAAELCADPSAPVAPLLQIVLTRMWAEARKKSQSEPRFTQALYDEQKYRQLDDFVGAQLKAAGEEPGLVEAGRSGLVLDVLVFHTTDESTSCQRSLPEIEERYAHVRAVVPPLLETLKRLYLLSDPSPDSAGPQATRLAHDTLARFLRSRFEHSSLPGQRARRRLETSAEDWKAGATGRPLDEGDLALVENGLAGMRALTADEKRLLEASKVRAEESRVAAKRRKYYVAAAGVAGLLLVAAGYVAWDQSRKSAREATNRERTARIAEAQTAITRADKATTPVDALPDLCRAVDLLPEDEDLLDRTIARTLHVFNEAPLVSRSFDLAIVAADISADGRSVLLLPGPGVGNLHVLHLRPGEIASGKVRGPVTMLKGPESMRLEGPRLSPDGKRAFAIDRSENKIRVWDVASGDQVFELKDQSGRRSDETYWSGDGNCILEDPVRPRALACFRAGWQEGPKVKLESMWIHQPFTALGAPLGVYLVQEPHLESFAIAPLFEGLHLGKKGEIQDHLLRIDNKDALPSMSLSESGAFLAALIRVSGPDLRDNPVSENRLEIWARDGTVPSWTQNVSASLTDMPDVRDVDDKGRWALVTTPISEGPSPTRVVRPDSAYAFATDAPDLACGFSSTPASWPRLARAEYQGEARDVATCGGDKDGARWRNVWFDGPHWPSLQPVDLRKLTAHRASLKDNWVVGVTNTGDLRVLSMRSPAEERKLEGRIRAAAYSSDGSTLAVLTDPGPSKTHPKLWVYRRGDAPVTLGNQAAESDHVLVSPEGSHVAVEEAFRTHLVNVKSRAAATLAGSPQSAALKGDGTLIAALGRVAPSPEAKRHILEITTGSTRRSHEVPLLRGELRSSDWDDAEIPFAFTGDGQFLIYRIGALDSTSEGRAERRFQLQNAKSGELTSTIAMPTSDAEIFFETVLQRARSVTWETYGFVARRMRIVVPGGAQVDLVVDTASSTPLTFAARGPELPAPPNGLAAPEAPLVFSGRKAVGPGAFCISSGHEKPNSPGRGIGPVVPLFAYIEALPSRAVRPTAPWVPIIVEDLTSGSILATFYSTDVKALTFSPDCERLHAVGEDGVERSWFAFHRYDGKKPSWVGRLGAFLIGRGPRMQPDGVERVVPTPEMLDGDERARFLDEVRAAKAAGDPGAAYVLLHLFGPEKP